MKIIRIKNTVDHSRSDWGLYKTKKHLGARNNSNFYHFHAKEDNNILKKEANKSKKDELHYSNMCFGGFALVVSIIATFPITLIPVHNIVIHPEFWYEQILTFTPFTLFSAIFIAVRASIVFESYDKELSKKIFYLWFPATIFANLFVYLFHFVWTTILGFIEPMPFRCFPMLTTFQTFLLVRFWQSLSTDQNLGTTFPKRRIGFTCYLLWSNFLGYQMVAMSKLFKMIPLDFQCTAGFAILLVKELNDRVIGKILSKTASNEKMSDVQLVGKIDSTVRFSYWIAIFMATTATETTGYVMLGINFVVNLALCFKIMKLKRKTELSELDMENESEIKDAVRELIFNETIELLVPISFIASYLIAFYGPNHDILVSVGCDYWTFGKVEDLHSFLMPVLIMAIIDCGSGVLSEILLLKFSHLNISMEYCSIIKKYWKILTFCAAYSSASVISYSNKIIFNLHFITSIDNIGYKTILIFIP